MHIYIYIYHVYIYIYIYRERERSYHIYIYIYREREIFSYIPQEDIQDFHAELSRATANFPTNIMDFRGFDSSKI